MSSRRVARAKLVGRNAFASFEYAIDARQIRIGSGAINELILPHHSVSARHAVVHRKRGSYYIRDLGSTNGTFLNGKRLEREQRLRPGDEVRFGAARFALVGTSRGFPAVRYFAAATGLLLLAAIGYLAVNFISNWSNLEQLSTTAPAAKPSTSLAIVSPAIAPAAAVPSISSAPAIPSAREAEVTKNPAATAPPPPWLAAINEYRAVVNLSPVADDSRLSEGARKHAMYVVKNYEDKVGPGHLIGAEMHEEESGNRWFTPEGAQAGQESDVNQLWGPERMPSPLWALNNWFDGPFHRLWILNPKLRRVGYGEFCEKQYCVAALDLGSGAEETTSAAPLASPIEYPADKSIITRNSFSGEWPTPLTSCPGYSFPAGYAATIQLGALVEAKLGEYQLTRDAHGVESCGIDATNYQNPVASEQERGRGVLRQLGAATIIPRYPLKPGHYSVTATINDHTYQWSFTLTGKSPAVILHEEAAERTEHPKVAANTETNSSEKDDLDAAMRLGYARVIKGDSSGRDEYGHDAEDKAAAAVAAAVKLREFIRRRETAFPAGPGDPAPVGPNQWLVELNRNRASVDLPPVTEDPSLSDGDLKHAKYLVANYPTRDDNIGAAMHQEDPAKPGYTPEGAKAGSRSNVAPYWYFPPPAPPPPPTTALLFLNGWLAGPFHRALLLSPELHQVGYAQFCQDRACAAALDVSEALKPISGPAPYAQPILFPPQKYSIALFDVQNEFPNPAAACAGYQFPIGLPITIQLGTNFDAKLGSYSVTQSGRPVEACGYDWMTYTNPNADEQARARKALNWSGEVVIVPRKPLERGATYQVSATVNDHPYQWSFSISK